jgi:type IV pilus assembly protein PilO
MKLKIINKTDKTVDVNITGDDSTNPRVTIDADNSNVKVNKS